MREKNIAQRHAVFKRKNSILIYHSFLKRILDIVLATIAIIVLSPLWILVFLILIIFSRPVFFKQKRPGQNGKIFTLYKFRTMRHAYDEQGRPLPDAQRLTWWGRLLRKLSLDELPELYNVLKGDMSLVGPRPLLVQYLDRYTPQQARRHEVRPGITGLAQISGRNEISWEKRFELDVWYVDHLSFWLDVKILALTLIKVFKAEGISQRGQATREEFRGK